jgi:hypothetical protein
MYTQKQNRHGCNYKPAEDKHDKTNEVRALDAQSTDCMVAIQNR